MTERGGGVTNLLKKTAFRTIDIEQFLNRGTPSWAWFDPELGYVPDSLVICDGGDGSFSTYTYEPAGNRKVIAYAGARCRINTYGDSFAQCQQVSDGETWQERLAAHIGEPVRNFGVGGYGVYQAWRRARRIESSTSGTEYVILSIYDDDHVRNLDACRWIRTFADAPEPPPDRPIMLHGIPWCHVRFDLETGRWVELPSLTPTPESLRRLCDPDCFVDTFKHDFIVRLFALQMGYELENVQDLETMAEALGVKVDLRNPASRRSEAWRLRIEYGLRSSEYVLEQLLAWFKQQSKKLLVVLCYGEGRIMDAIEGKERFDQRFVEFLQMRGVPYVDLLSAHVADYRAYRVSPREYVDRFFINAAGAAVFGHYNPRGNLFYAFEIKDAVVRWLFPRPPAYSRQA